MEMAVDPRMKQQRPLQVQRGGSHPLARFTDEQARRIRAEAGRSPLSTRKLAAQHHCSHMTMWRLLHCVTYPDDGL
jgi:hypothetical protein